MLQPGQTPEYQMPIPCLSVR